MIGRQVVIWWANAGHWRIWCDGEQVEAQWFRVKDAVSDVKQDGFKEYPGGPRGILRGTLDAWETVT